MIAAFAYYYMVLAWGGYIFVIGYMSIFTIGLVVLNRLDTKAYITFSIVYIVGNLLSLNIPFVSYYAVWNSSEHLPSHLAFALCQIVFVKGFLQSKLSERAFKILGSMIAWIAGIGVVAGIIFVIVMGKATIGHRIIALINPIYAKKSNPLTSSISEHASTPWPALYTEVHHSLLFAPLGAIILMVFKPNNSKIFGTLYCLISTYFASVMVRLKMVAAPSNAILTGVGLSFALSAMAQSIKDAVSYLLFKLGKQSKQPVAKTRVPWEFSIVGIFLIGWILTRSVFHGSLTAAVNLTSNGVTREVNFNDGGRLIIDELREGLYWLRKNTDPDATVMSWWDYGYQIAAFANRSTVIDNNTWNKTHIARVGMVGVPNQDLQQSRRRGLRTGQGAWRNIRFGYFWRRRKPLWRRHQQVPLDA